MTACPASCRFARVENFRPDRESCGWSRWHEGWWSFRLSKRGKFSYGFVQRPHFAHVSNFNVGLFAQQAGLTLDEAHRFAGEYASLLSRNADPSKPYGLNE